MEIYAFESKMRKKNLNKTSAKESFRETLERVTKLTCLFPEGIQARRKG